jgi:hypothetical protein
MATKSTGLITYLARISTWLSPTAVVANNTSLPTEIKHVIVDQTSQPGFGILTSIRKKIEAATTLVPEHSANSVPQHGILSVARKKIEGITNSTLPVPSIPEQAAQQVIESAPVHSWWYYAGWGVVCVGVIAGGAYGAHWAYLEYLDFKAKLYPFLFALGWSGNFDWNSPGAKGVIGVTSALGLWSTKKVTEKIDLTKVMPSSYSQQRQFGILELPQEMQNATPNQKSQFLQSLIRNKKEVQLDKPINPEAANVTPEKIAEQLAKIDSEAAIQIISSVEYQSLTKEMPTLAYNALLEVANSSDQVAAAIQIFGPF